MKWLFKLANSSARQLAYVGRHLADPTKESRSGLGWQPGRGDPINIEEADIAKGVPNNYEIFFN